MIAVPHVWSWQVETMRNEVETRLWWSGLAFVVWLFEGLVGGKAQGGGGVWCCLGGVAGRKAATCFARRQGR